MEHFLSDTNKVSSSIKQVGSMSIFLTAAVTSAVIVIVGEPKPIPPGSAKVLSITFKGSAILHYPC